MLRDLQKIWFKLNTGSVGIGTTAPTEKLEVSGNIKASGTVSQGSSKEFKPALMKIREEYLLCFNEGCHECPQ